MSKYSSFKEHQLITENWRKFVAEEHEDDSIPADVLKALDILSDGPMEEGWDPMPLPISPEDLRARQRDPESWDERSLASQAAITALANAIHGTVHGARLLKKGGTAAAAMVSEYLEQNPDKVAALKTINDAIARHGKVAGHILKKVAALVAAGSMAAFLAFAVYDGARATIDDTYESVLYTEPADSDYDGGWLDPAPGGAR